MRARPASTGQFRCVLSNFDAFVQQFVNCSVTVAGQSHLGAAHPRPEVPPGTPQSLTIDQGLTLRHTEPIFVLDKSLLRLKVSPQ